MIKIKYCNLKVQHRSELLLKLCDLFDVNLLFKLQEDDQIIPIGEFGILRWAAELYDIKRAKDFWMFN